MTPDMLREVRLQEAEPPTDKYPPPAAAGHLSQESNSKTAPVNGSLVPIEI